jgi:hypothetical protein
LIDLFHLSELGDNQAGQNGNDSDEEEGAVEAIYEDGISYDAFAEELVGIKRIATNIVAYNNNSTGIRCR